MKSKIAASAASAPSPKDPREARTPPPDVAALARAHALDPRDLLGWAVRADGSVVILTPDGRKYLSDRTT